MCTMAANTAALDRSVAWYQSQAWAPTTLRTYRVQFKAYLTFCERFSLNPVPISPRQLCWYIAYLARRLSYGSIRQYLNAVRILHDRCGFSAPIQDFNVQITLRGVKRVKGDCPGRKSPMTPALLLHILANLDLHSPTQAAVFAAALTLFFGVLRRANLIPPQDAPFDHTRHLRRRDVTITPQGATLLIRWTKTNQYRNKVVVLPLPRLPKHVLCPTQAIKHYFSLTPGADPDGPAWVVPGRRGLYPLTPKLFVETVKASLRHICDGNTIGGHSFRRGGAIWLRQCGVGIPLIREIGDWASDAYMRYVVTSPHTIAKTISQAAQNLPQWDKI